MIGALFNALAGRSDFGTTGHKINAAAGQQAIGLQLDKAGRQNAALQYSLAAGSRGAGTGLAIREAQRRAQLGMGQAAESAAIASQQLQQGVAEANQRAALQADQINQEVSLANAKNLQPLAMAGAAAAGGAVSDERAKMPLGIRPGPARTQEIPQMLPPVSDRYTFAPIGGGKLSVGQQEANIAVESAARDRTADYLGNTDPKFGAPGEVSAPRVNYVVSDPDRMRAVGERAFALAPGESMHVDPAMYERPVDIQQAAYAPGKIGPTTYATPGVSTSASRSGGDVPGWAGALSGLLSDERSKQKIMELEAANRGLTAMLHKARPAPAGPAMQPAIRPGAVSSAPITPPAMPRMAPQPAYDVTSTPSPGLVRVQSSQPLSAPEQAQLDMEQAMSDYRSKMLSDERAKNAVSYLRPVHPVAYQYKPEFVASGEGDPGPQVGLLAQDLERTPIGATVVQQGPDGMKRVQVPQLLMLNTAADAEQQRQIDELKRRRRA